MPLTTSLSVKNHKLRFSETTITHNKRTKEIHYEYSLDTQKKEMRETSLLIPRGQIPPVHFCSFKKGIFERNYILGSATIRLSPLTTKVSYSNNKLSSSIPLLLNCFLCQSYSVFSCFAKQCAYFVCIFFSHCCTPNHDCNFAL